MSVSTRAVFAVLVAMTATLLQEVVAQVNTEWCQCDGARSTLEPLDTDTLGYTVNAVLTIDSCLAGCQAIAGCTYTWLYQGDGSATDLPRCWYNRLDAASGAYEDDITGNIRMYKGKCAALNLVGDKCKDISAAAPSGQVTLQDMYDVTTTVAVTGGPITLADPHLQTTSSGSSASSASSAVSEVSAATGAVTKRARRRAH